MKKLVICEINENYLENVKKQMKKQEMPLPKDDSQITIAHKPLATVEAEPNCKCHVCKKINSI